MYSTSSCYSLIKISFKLCCCPFVIIKSPWQKPVLTTHLSKNPHWGSHLSKVLSHCTQNKIQTVTVNLTQCDCLYPCLFHIIFIIRWKECNFDDFSSLRYDIVNFRNNYHCFTYITVCFASIFSNYYHSFHLIVSQFNNNSVRFASFDLAKSYIHTYF